MKPEFVLDSSAVLALVKREPGADRVRDCVARSVVSAVNVAEIGAKLSDWGVSGAALRHALADLGFAVAPFDAGLALVSADLRGATRPCGLSLGDRACLALARSAGLPALTADREWRGVVPDVRIELIRE